MKNAEDLREINRYFSIFLTPFMSLVHRNNSQFKPLHKEGGEGAFQNILNRDTHLRDFLFNSQLKSQTWTPQK